MKPLTRVSIDFIHAVAVLERKYQSLRIAAFETCDDQRGVNTWGIGT